MGRATRHDTGHGASTAEATTAEATTTEATTTDGAPADARGRRRNTVVWWLSSLGAAAVVAAIHVRLAQPRQGPRILADEIGYLANARFLAGGGKIDMSHTAFYAGGYSLVIAPLSKLFAYHPARLYASVIGLQALFAGASVLLIAQLCRWLLGTPRSWSLLVAVAAGCYPTFVTDTGFAWSESTLTFTLLVVITLAVAMQRQVATDAPRSRLLALAAGLGVACGALFTIHNRTVLAVFGVVVITAFMLVRRRQMLSAALLAGIAVVTILAGESFNAYLRRALWNGHGEVNVDDKLSTLRHWRRVTAGLLRLDGQSWYQVVGTGGIVVVAVVALVLLAGRRPARDDRGTPVNRVDTAKRSGALVVLAVFFGLLFVSAAYLATGNRADHIVYGRYVDIVTPLLIAIGLAWLGTAPARRDLVYAALAMAAATAGFWFVLHRTGRTELARPFNVVTTFAILGWLEYPRYSPALFRATVWAFGIGFAAIAVAFVARWSSRARWVPTVVATACVVALFAWNLGFVHSKVLPGLAESATPTRALVNAVANAHVDELRTDPTIKVVGYLSLQYWLPHVHVIRGTAKNEQCKRGLTVSRSSDPRTGEVYVASIGRYSLFRGTVDCPD